MPAAPAGAAVTLVWAAVGAIEVVGVGWLQAKGIPTTSSNTDFIENES